MKFSEHSVFVYGTLKPGGRYWHEFCAGRVGEPMLAKIRGELYDLHVGYPGLLLNTGKHESLPSNNGVGGNWVEGYILTFRQEADFLRLDHLEGYEPGRPDTENEYNRLKVTCFSPTGEVLGEVWAYEMTDATMQRHKATLIPEGNWQIP